MSAFETEWEKPEFDSVPSLAENAVYLLPECNDVILRKTLQEVYRDFCKRSAALRTWRRVVLPRPEEPPAAHGGLDVIRCGFMVSPVLSGEIDCITQVLRGDTHTPVHGWRVNGVPPMLTLPPLSVHDLFFGHLAPVPSEHPNSGSTLPQPPQIPVDGVPPPPPPLKPSLLVEAVEIPSLSEERAPKAFLSRYGDALVDGALVRLFSMTNRPWSDPEQARQRGLAYSNALSEARQRGMCGGPDANAGHGFALDLSSMV